MLKQKPFPSSPDFFFPPNLMQPTTERPDYVNPHNTERR